MYMHICTYIAADTDSDGPTKRMVPADSWFKHATRRLGALPACSPKKLEGCQAVVETARSSYQSWCRVDSIYVKGVKAKVGRLPNEGPQGPLKYPNSMSKKGLFQEVLSHSFAYCWLLTFPCLTGAHAKGSRLPDEAHEGLPGSIRGLFWLHCPGC